MGRYNIFMHNMFSLINTKYQFNTLLLNKQYENDFPI